jgi:hypothetical protein
MPKTLTLDEMIQLARECEPDGGQLRSLADSTVRTIELMAGNLGLAIARHLSVTAGVAAYKPEDGSGPIASFHASRIGQPCPSPLKEIGPSEWNTLKGVKLDPETGG